MSRWEAVTKITVALIERDRPAYALAIVTVLTMGAVAVPVTWLLS